MKKPITTKQAIKTIKQFQKWRRGEIDICQPSPVLIGACIDVLIKFAEEKTKRLMFDPPNAKVDRAGQKSNPPAETVDPGSASNALLGGD